MPEQPNTSAAQSSQGGRPSWAWLLFDGPVAVLILIFGVILIIGQRTEWSKRANDFQAECQKQDDLQHAQLERVAVNRQLRALLPRLAEHPHHYQTPVIPNEANVAYHCPAAEQPPPSMPSASFGDLAAALFAPLGSE